MPIVRRLTSVRTRMFLGHALAGVESALKVSPLSIVRRDLPGVDLPEEFTQARQDVQQSVTRFLVPERSLLPRAGRITGFDAPGGSTSGGTTREGTGPDCRST